MVALGRVVGFDLQQLIDLEVDGGGRGLATHRGALLALGRVVRVFAQQLVE